VIVSHLEVDPLDADMAQRLQEARAASESDPVLPEPLAVRMRAEAERACFPLPALSAMFPQMQLATLGGLALRSDGIYAECGSEVFLSSFARGLRKPVISLETPELQMRDAGASRRKSAGPRRDGGEMARQVGVRPLAGLGITLERDVGRKSGRRITALH
jgi:hypothetical protein